MSCVRMRVLYRSSAMALSTPAHEPAPGSEEPSLQRIQQLMLDAPFQLTTEDTVSCDQWFARCRRVVAAFESASDSTIEELMQCTPHGTGSAKWLVAVDSAIAPPLWLWGWLADLVSQCNRLDGDPMLLVERLFRVLMRTGCATSASLNERSGVGPSQTVLQYVLQFRVAFRYYLPAQLVLNEPNLCATLPRCQCVVNVDTGKLCGALVNTSKPALTTLGLAARISHSSPTFDLVVKRFGSELIAEEYAYAEFGACNGKHKGPRDERSTVKLENPLFICAHINDRNGMWLAAHLPSKRLNELSDDHRGSYTPLCHALCNNMPLTARAILARVPDHDLHALMPCHYHDDPYTCALHSGQPITITDVVDCKNHCIPEDLIEEVRTKAKVFGPNYHASAADLVAQLLGFQQQGRVLLPRELLRVVLEYSELPQSNVRPVSDVAVTTAAAAASEGADGGRSAAAAASAGAGAGDGNHLQLLAGRKRKR